MAVNESGFSSASRRFFFGTNVVIVILLMLVIVVGVNVVGHAKNWRRDVTGGFGGTQISQRGKGILEKAGADLRITSVYTSDEPEMDRKKYFGKVQDLAQEIRQVNKSIKVEHLYSGNERADLRKRVQGKFGGATEKYDEVITLAEALWTDLESTLAPARAQLEQILRSDSWLGGYPTMANIATIIRKDVENVEQTRKEVDDLVKGEGLPQYQEANNKIKTFNEELKKHLEDTQKWMGETRKMAVALSDPKNDFAAKTKAKLAEMKGLVDELRKVAGDPKDQNVPEDPKPVLTEYAKAANKLSIWLFEESARVEEFIKANPMVASHPRWVTRAQIGPFPTEIRLNTLLSQTSQDLSQVSQQLRQYLKQDVPRDQLQNLVRQLRDVSPQVATQLNDWSTGVTALFAETSKIDPNGKEMTLLTQAAEGTLFKAVLDKLNTITQKIGELPALKLDEVARRLQQDNIVVIETDKDVRVVTFDELWPVADPQAAQFSMGRDEDAQRRVFAGDGPITNAILNMQVSKPFATVVLVAWEPQVNPQMRQFMRAPQSPMPMETISKLRETLEAANFKVKEWNLAADQPVKPEIEEGTQPVYVCMPPAGRSQPNFMMPQQNEKQFGEAQIAEIKEALMTSGAAIFLPVWEPTNPMTGDAQEYSYGKYLRDDWGIDVKTEYRIIRGVVDKRDPGKYGISMSAWLYMPLNSFSDHPVGDPLKSRRLLVRDVCPIARAEKVPDDVKLTTILDVPATSNDTWADKDISRIIKALRSPDGGSFERGDDSLTPPFNVAMAAENDKSKSRIIVLGSSTSLRDDYLGNRVMRFEGKQSRLTTDPAPTENADLFVNAVYWLSGHKELISAGPAAVPVVPPISEGGRRMAWVTTFGWAALVGVAGAAVMFARRK